MVILEPKKIKPVIVSTCSPSICPEVMPVGIGPLRPSDPTADYTPSRNESDVPDSVIRTLLGSLGPPGLFKTWDHLNVPQQQMEGEMTGSLVTGNTALWGKTQPRVPGAAWRARAVVVCEGLECVKVNVRTGSDGGQRSGKWISLGVVTGRGLGGLQGALGGCRSQCDPFIRWRLRGCRHMKMHRLNPQDLCLLW